MTPPHIMVVNVHYAPHSYGGATVVAEEVARALVGRGCRVTAVSVTRRDDLAPYAVVRAQIGGQVSFLLNLPSRVSFAATYCNPEIADMIGQLMDRVAPDVVHLHCLQDVGAGVIETARARGIPTVLSVHDFWWICERQFMVRPDGEYCGQWPVDLSRCGGCVERRSATRTRAAYLARQAATADIVTYPSRFARELCEASGLAPGRGVVWPNGVHKPGEDFAARRRAGGPLTFGYIGGPSSIKGWPDIHAAFAGLDQSDFVVHLVDAALGGGWYDHVDFATLPGRWHVVPRFTQDGMDAFYAGIDVLLFPSQWKETFGLAIREALVRGIPVIQTDSGGTTEHTLADRDRMIPIGAGPDPLRAAILRHLDAGPVTLPAPPLPGFDDQADALLRMIRPFMTPASAPPPEAPEARHGSWDSAA